MVVRNVFELLSEGVQMKSIANYCLHSLVSWMNCNRSHVVLLAISCTVNPSYRSNWEKYFQFFCHMRRGVFVGGDVLLHMMKTSHDDPTCMILFIQLNYLPTFKESNMFQVKNWVFLWKKCSTSPHNFLLPQNLKGQGCFFSFHVLWTLVLILKSYQLFRYWLVSGRLTQITDADSPAG